MKQKELVALVLVLWAAICLIGCSNDTQSAGADVSTGSDDTVALNELPDLSAHAEDNYDVDASAENNSDASPERKPTIEELESIPIEEAMPWLGEVEAEDTNYVDPDIVEADSADAPESSYGLFQVSEAWAASNDSFYVKKPGIVDLISAGEKVPKYSAAAYDVGYRHFTVFPNGEDYEVALYFADYPDEIKHADVSSATDKAVISAGDLEPVVISKSQDELRYYGTNGRSRLYLTKTELIGYTVKAGSFSYYYVPIMDTEIQVGLESTVVSNVGLYDVDDNPVADYHNLEYGKEYLYEYYAGTQYYEIKMLANSRCYIAKNTSSSIQNLDYDIEPQLTKNGYIIYDISGVEPGLYVVGTAGDCVIEITE